MFEDLKWYCVILKDGTHMVVWRVKNETEAEIVAQAHIIRHRLDLVYDVESIFEINGFLDEKLMGIKDFLLANN